MEKELILIKMGIYMRVIIKMIMLKEKEFSIIKMEIEMKGNLKLGNLLEFI
jgi:hypothetical protein